MHFFLSMAGIELIIFHGFNHSTLFHRPSKKDSKGEYRCDRADTNEHDTNALLCKRRDAWQMCKLDFAIKSTDGCNFPFLPLYD